MSLNSKNIIVLRFKKINRCLDKLKQELKAEDIHEFRLEIKHLRAFLQLLAMEDHRLGEIKIPRKIEKAYKKTGKLRLVHLETESVKKFMDQKEEAGSSRYLKALRKKQKRLELKTENSVRSIRPLKPHKFLDALPKRIEHVTIQRFYEAKEVDIGDILLKRQTDEKKMHEARKSLKYLLYNSKWTSHDPGAPQFGSGQTKFIKELESKIGSYHDVLKFLQPFSNHHPLAPSSSAQGIFLQTIKQKWEEDKKRLLKEIDLLIPAIPFLKRIG
jgi:CHAD domain-containing protein